MFDIDKVPGWLTWLGASVSLAGIFLITIGGFELEKENKAKQEVDQEFLVEMSGPN
jgi:hypothetical protein